MLFKILRVFGYNKFGYFSTEVTAKNIIKETTSVLRSWNKWNFSYIIQQFKKNKRMCNFEIFSIYSKWTGYVSLLFQIFQYKFFVKKSCTVYIDNTELIHILEYTMCMVFFCDVVYWYSSERIFLSQECIEILSKKCNYPYERFEYL